ncbi:hypothetical protein SAMN06269250_0669 [Spirosoma fluviale]|uniref:Uncharacterized protein n=1 Tax=Spirosoma fluviale TaxID=1597977 RepID=A0A286F6N0_9BACT|nr:hypothetical protein SAMN06269250_0669 [Spirosoma fluviale]
MDYKAIFVPNTSFILIFSWLFLLYYNLTRYLMIYTLIKYGLISQLIELYRPIT